MTNATTLPLSQLRIDPKANVRHINRGVDPVLLASIKAIGLRSPLSVRKNGAGYMIFAGGQRFLALQEIAKENKTPDMPVPVIITEEADAAALEASLHENVARSAMHPVDEYRAYALLANDKDHPMSLAQIAERFGVSERGVSQRLALGALDDSVLNAWQAGEIDGKLVRLFTLEPNKKAQKAALEKARTNYLNDYNIRDALGINQERRLARALLVIGEEAYLARGGKVIKDLFAEGNRDATQVSDPELIKTMIEELLDKEVEQLKAAGWGVVTKEVPNDIWNYRDIEVKAGFTKEENARIKEIGKTIEAAEEADETDEDIDALDDERNGIIEAANQRALAAVSPKMKAAGIAFVALYHDWSRIEITFKKQPEKVKASTSTADGKSATPAKKKTKPEDNVSQALMIRQAEQLTAAAKVAILKQPNVAIAMLIAAISTNDAAISIKASHVDHKRPKFDATLASSLKLTTAQQVEVLTKLVSQNINLVKHYAKQPVLTDPSHLALANAINGKALTTATREKWDAKDHFNSVSRPTIVAAVREAMGDDHARKVEAMSKPDAAKFAIANLPKLGWLPKQLRVAGYDGPSAKAAAKKASPKKASKAKR